MSTTNDECLAGRDDCDCATYDTDEAGLITNPGKFERETPAVVHFYNIGLEGFADSDEIVRGVPVYKFKLRSTDGEIFPELKGKKSLSIIEDDQGFVRAG